MASVHNFFIVVAIVFTAIVSSAYVAESRPLTNTSTKSLAERLKMSGDPSNCWESLFQLQACSGEIITFFLNGETYLGNGCCQAIRVIGHDCWPSIVGTLGFTNEETDILEGYCDEAVHSTPPSSIVNVVEHKEITP